MIAPTSAPAREHRCVQPDAVARAGGDQESLAERRLRAEHARVHRAVVLEARQVLVAEQCLQVEVLLRCGLVPDRLERQPRVLLAQLLVLVLRRQQSVEPAVEVAERARDPLGADLEGAHRGRPDVLRAVQRPVVRLAEVDREEREREHDEDAHHHAAPGRAAGSGGVRRGGTLDGTAQHRQSGGSVARHELRQRLAGWRALAPVIVAVAGTSASGGSTSNSSRLRPEPTATQVSGLSARCDRHERLVAEPLVEPRQERPAAGEDDAAIHDVRRELGRGLVEGRLDRVDDLVDRVVERRADLLGGEDRPSSAGRSAGRARAPRPASLPSGGTRSRPRA